MDRMQQALDAAGREPGRRLPDRGEAQHPSPGARNRIAAKQRRAEMAKSPVQPFQKGAVPGVVAREGKAHQHAQWLGALGGKVRQVHRQQRSEEHTSELQSLMRISYAVFCLKKKKQTRKITPK